MTRRVLTTLLATAAMIMAAGGCRSGSSDEPAQSAPSVSAADLQTKVIERVESFFVDERPSAGTGPVDIDDLAQTVAARSRLSGAGFLGGYRRVFTNAAGETVVVTIEQFADSAGAQKVLEAASRGAAASDPNAAQGPIPGVDRGFVIELGDTEDSGDYAREAMFANGAHLVTIRAVGVDDASLSRVFVILQANQQDALL